MRLRALLVVPMLLLIAAAIATSCVVHDEESVNGGRWLDRASEEATARAPGDDKAERASTPERSADHEHEAAEDTGNLTVRLVDINGDSVEGVPVRGRTASRVEWNGVSGDDGRVLLRDLPEGLVEVTYDLSGWRTDFDISGRRVRVPFAGELVLVMPQVSWLRGRVVDANRHPVPRARVGIGTSGVGGSALDCAVVADDEGRYQLAVSEDSWSMQSFLIAWARGLATANAYPSEGGPGLSVRRDFVLAPLTPENAERSKWAGDLFAGLDAWDALPVEVAERDSGGTFRSVVGRVVDPEGTPLAGAVVRASVTGHASRSGPDGRFTVRLSTWHDRLVVEADGHYALSLEPPADGADFGDLKIKPRTDVRIRLVFEDDRAPVVGAWTYMQWEVSAITNEDGTAVMRGVDPQAMLDDRPLMVRPGRTDRPQPVPGWTGPVHRDGITEILATRGRRTSGTVLQPDGLPLLGAWCVVEDGDSYSDLWAMQVTDLAGRFVVGGLPRDRAATVVVAHDSYPHAELVTPPGPQDDDIDVTLRFPEGVLTRGVLRPADDDGTETLHLRAVPLPPFEKHVRPVVHYLEIGPERTFSFPSVVGQRYRLLLARGSAYACRLGPEDVVLAGATDVVVKAHQGASISGNVRDRRGPLKGALLQFRNVADDLDTAFAESLRRGRFEVPGLAPGATYAVRAKKSKHAPKWVDVTRLAAGTKGVVIDLR